MLYVHHLLAIHGSVLLQFNVMSYTVNGDLVNGLPFRLKTYCKASGNKKYEVDAFKIP